MQVAPLPFGSANSELTLGLADSAQALARAIPGLRNLDAPESARFRARAATCAINEVRVLAHSALSCRMEIAESPGLVLVVPCAGRIVMTSESHIAELIPGESALLISDLRRLADRLAGTAVIASLNPERLTRTRAAMAGLEPDAVPPDDPVNQLDLRHRPGIFPAFLKICGMIDLVSQNEGLAQSLGLDDLIYRWVATVTSPTLSGMTQANDNGTPAHRGQVDLLCDTIRNRDTHGLTLTEMEVVTGLSGRSLQYAFHRRFGCSPMTWQRNERLIMARQRLLQAGPDESITSIAHAMGYSSSAAFSTLFRRAFGEAPSQYLRTTRSH